MVIFSNAFKAVVSNQANVFSKTSSNVPTTQEESNKAMLFYDQEKVKLKQKKTYRKTQWLYLLLFLVILFFRGGIPITANITLIIRGIHWTGVYCTGTSTRAH